MATLFEAEETGHRATVEVIAVIFAAEDDGYAVLEVEDVETAEGFALVGPVAHLSPGDRAEVSGEWQSHPQYGRQLRALNLRLQKIDKARQFSGQQLLQARRQVEALQKDLAAQNEVLARAQLATQRSRHLEDALRAASTAEPSGAMPLAPAHGFADTLPLA